MKKTPSKKSGSSVKQKYEVIELPSDNAGMEEYVSKNRKEINERIIDNIEYALKNRLGGVEIFCFKNSNFVVVLNRKDFKDSLQGIFEFCLENEQFELCERAKKTMKRVDKLCYVYTYNKAK